MAIAVLALVGTGIGAEMGCRAFRGDCTLPDAGDSGSVVREVVGGRILKRELRGLDGDLAQETSMFQVTVGDGSGRVGGGYDGGLDIRREGHSPQVGLSNMVEEDTTHAGLGSIRGTEESGSLGDDLCKVSWMVA